MAWGRLIILAGLCIATLVACESYQRVQSTAALQRAFWGLPVDGPRADVTSLVSCPNGYECDVFANAANYNDPKPNFDKRLTVVWTCQPQRFVLSAVAPQGLKVRMACVAQQPLVPRNIQILEATWGSGGAGRTVDVTQQVRDICGDSSTRCQVPAMAYIFGMPDKEVKSLRIRPAGDREQHRRPALRAFRRSLQVSSASRLSRLRGSEHRAAGQYAGSRRSRYRPRCPRAA